MWTHRYAILSCFRGRRMAHVLLLDRGRLWLILEVPLSADLLAGHTVVHLGVGVLVGT